MRKMRGIRLPYRKQGLIYFTCLNFREQPKAVQEKIVRLCVLAGGEYDAALLELLTVEHVSVEDVSLRHHVSASVLYRRRKAFYEAWFRGGE